MKFHAALSDAESTSDAIERVIDDVRVAIGDVDACFVFFTPHHKEQAQEIVEQLWLELDPQSLIGCTVEGVIGCGREIERQPGIVVLAGQMPNVRLHPFHITTDRWRELLAEPNEFRELLGVGDETRAIIGFGDPWTTPLNQFLQTLDTIAAQSPLIGGMASGARSPGDNILVHNDAMHEEGFVGVSLSGAVEVQSIVSQGARPIGSPMIVTKASENVIEQLGGKPAMQVLREMVNQLPQRDQALLEHGLLFGRAISEYREKFSRGDFLVRNLTGADEESGAIAVADHVRVGQTVQFHVRDAESADEDLKLMLDAISPPAAGLLFSCNGRGTRMFESAHHDISVAGEKLPQVPIAGFFAAGEFGPVGGKNFIHGHTASFALIREKK